MKSFVFSAMMVVGLCSMQVQAQTATTSTATTSTTTTAPAPAATPQIPGISTEERTQIIDARTKAMAANPNLQKEETDLMQKAMVLRSGTPSDADKEAFKTDVQAHIANMRAAMLKIDPTLKPILDRLETQAAASQAAH